MPDEVTKHHDVDDLPYSSVLGKKSDVAHPERRHVTA